MMLVSKRASDIFQNIVTSDKEKQIGRRETNYGTAIAPKSNKEYSTAGKVVGYIVPEKGTTSTDQAVIQGRNREDRRPDQRGAKIVRW